MRRLRSLLPERPELPGSASGRVAARADEQIEGRESGLQQWGGARRGAWRLESEIAAVRVVATDTETFSLLESCFSHGQVSTACIQSGTARGIRLMIVSILSYRVIGRWIINK